MKTLAALAKELRVKPKTLGFRLWDEGIEPTRYRLVKGTNTKFYDAAAIRRIKKHLKDDPIKRVGRPRIRKGKK